MVSGSKVEIERRVVGLSCPACGGTLDLREGATVERCPFCDTPLLLNVPGNVPRYSAVRRLDESKAWLAVERWLQSRLEEHQVWRGASRRLPWPFDRARMEEALLVYAPFWVVSGRQPGCSVAKSRSWWTIRSCPSIRRTTFPNCRCGTSCWGTTRWCR